MKNKILRTLCILLCGVCILSCAACNFPGTGVTPITELNQPFKSSVIEITATEIKAIPDPEQEGNTLVGVNFVVENVSNKDFYIPGNINTYVDNVLMSDTFSARMFGKNSRDLMSRAILAPQKSTIGYYCVHVPKDTKNIEIHIDWIESIPIVFNLEVPVVSTTSAEYPTNTPFEVPTENPTVPESSSYSFFN